MNPRFPVYVISKGRWETSHTAHALDAARIPYRLVVEPQEVEQYSRVISPSKILVLPFSNLGQGSIPARNFVWDHSTESGAAWHWILDDNIRGFYRYNYNQKVPCADGTIFYAAEEFALRYENVGQAGFNYYMFLPRKEKKPPFYLNTRIYSCILNRNDITWSADGQPMRWRGRYNEDTDLSLRILKDGWCTILFNAFLANKLETMSMKGGNTDELYADDGRLQMAQSLVDQHPDVVRLNRRWGRYQHLVDYRPFKANLLRRKPGIVIPQGVNDFGMVFQERDPVTGQWVVKHPSEPMRDWFTPEAPESLRKHKREPAARRARARREAAEVWT